MKNEVDFILETENKDRTITIRPVNQLIRGTNQFTTGVFSLTERRQDLGEIVFDDQMDQWEYTGMGDLTHKEAEQVALFIKSYPEEESASA